MVVIAIFALSYGGYMTYTKFINPTNTTLQVTKQGNLDVTKVILEDVFTNDNGKFSLVMYESNLNNTTINKLGIFDENNNKVKEFESNNETAFLNESAIKSVVGNKYAYITTEDIGEGIPPLILIDLNTFDMYIPNIEAIFLSAFRNMKPNGMYGSQIVGFASDTSLKLQRTDSTAKYSVIVTLPDFKLGEMKSE